MRLLRGAVAAVGLGIVGVLLVPIGILGVAADLIWKATDAILRRLERR